MNKYSIIKNSSILKPNTVHLGNLDANHSISTTWVLNSQLSEKQINELVADITTKCKDNGLSVTTDLPYHLKVSGSAANFSKFFKIDLHKKQLDDNVYHMPSSDLKIPFMWKNKVVNVLGLNTGKIAHPYVKVRNEVTRATTTFNPLQLATLYNFPVGLNGSSQKIGIIELGGGYRMSDFTTYFSMLNIPGSPKVTDVNVDGATNNPSDPSGANVEVILDIEIIAAIVPNANILVYFAPNSYQGFYNAINKAINDECSVISISWGAAEQYWSSSTLTSYNNLFQSAANKNITILAAAGDNGSSDGASGTNVDFPSSSPYVLACGGTRLVANSSVTDISQETVWNVNQNSATGGGISKTFAKPSYQNNVTYNLNGKRGVPDVSGDADPNSGYVIYSEGSSIVVGGTSAVAPLWAGLISRINQSLGKSVGFLHPTLYAANPNVCRDIIQGNNGSYSAGVNWDACTGLGSPNGQELLNLLAGTVVVSIAPVTAFSANVVSGTKPLQVQFTDKSTNLPNSWLWDFGDNTTSSLQSPAHTYQNAGNYTVKLAASNNGGSNLLTKTNYITVNNPVVVSPVVPVTAFSANILSGIKPLQVQFTDQSVNVPTSWLWDFGDSVTSSLQNPSHIYQNAGNYTVKLTSINSGGSNLLTKANYISVTNPVTVVASVAAFSANPLTIKKGNYVTFTNLSTNATSYLWNYGDGITGTSKNPIHRYNKVGKYTVSLRASNGSSTNSVTKTSYITVTN